MIVYRVENKRRTGPYRTGDAFWPHATDIGETPGERIPLPYLDDMPTPPEPFAYVFGFKSKRQYRQWFTVEDCRVLKARNYCVVRYSVPRDFVFTGRKQLVFDPRKAKKLAKLDPCIKV